MRNVVLIAAKYSDFKEVEGNYAEGVTKNRGGSDGFC